MSRKSRRLKRLLVTLLTTVMAGVSYLFIDSHNEQTYPVQSPQLDGEEADYYGEGIYYKQYNSAGQLQQVLNSQTTEHYPSAEVSEFTYPTIDASNDDGELWRIQARTGVMKDQDSLVTFKDDVVIQPLNPEPGQQVLITTELLHYHTKDQVATSDLPIKIESESTTITGIGMSLYVPSEKLMLNQQVKTYYAPPSQP